MSRVNAVSQSYLLWRRGAGWVTNAEFLADPAAVVGGQQADDAELHEVIDLLVHRGLVKGPQAQSESVPNPALLTDEGVICVVDHDGDVQKWIANNRAGVFDQSTHVSGQGNQVVAHSANVKQNQHTEISNVQTLRHAAEQALEGLDTYEIDDDEDADEVRRAAQRALEATEHGEPEPGRLKRLATTLWAALLSFANTAAGLAFAEQLRDLLLPLVTMAAT